MKKLTGLQNSMYLMLGICSVFTLLDGVIDLAKKGVSAVRIITTVASAVAVLFSAAIVMREVREAAAE
jgi:hypothetical protein